MKVRLGYNDLDYNDIFSMTNRPNGIDYTLYLWRYTTTIAVWVTRPFAYKRLDPVENTSKVDFTCALYVTVVHAST